MYFFTPNTIIQANKNIEKLDSKAGGLLCILHCLVESIEENVSYTINGEQLRRQLSMVFDKKPKESYQNMKSSYIIFAKNWATTFFDNYIKNEVDLLSCAVFFLRRYGFDKECTNEEVIDIFVNRFNLHNYMNLWFCDNSTFQLAYNQCDVEANQADFYINMNYITDFKSILFQGIIQKSATDLKAAGQIQTLYSGSGVHTCFLLSDEPLDQYYIMKSSSPNCSKERFAGTQSNESAFGNWLSELVKKQGEPHSEITFNQYISVLKTVGNTFVDAMTPFVSVFQITDTDIFKRIISDVKVDEGYEKFNLSCGDGILSTSLELYNRFLCEQTETTNLMFTPEWFQEAAAEYPTFNSEAEKLIDDFQAKFNPEYLASLSGLEMLNTIFLNPVNPENMCRVLEFDPQIKDTFGSIKGGNAYKYGLYFSTKGVWMAGSHQKPRQLTEKEAIEVGTKLRDYLVAGANSIKEYGQLLTLDDYRKLYIILSERTEGLCWRLLAKKKKNMPWCEWAKSVSMPTNVASPT